MRTLSWLAVGLLLLACACDRRLDHGVEFIIGVATNNAPRLTSDELQLLVKAMAGRIDKLGYRSEVRAAGEDRVSVKLPFAAVESMGKGRSWLTRGGMLEFRLVHQQSEQLLRDGLIPAAFTVMQESRVLPGGQRQVVPLVVAKARVAGLSGTNISNAFFTRGNLNDPQVGFQFDKAGSAAFANITTTNVGRQLAIIMDGEVYSAPMIREPITQGSGTISGGSMTEADALEVVVLLENPFPVPVRIIEEKVF